MATKVKYLMHKTTERLYPYNETLAAREDFREATAEEVKAHFDKLKPAEKKSARKAPANSKQSG